MKKKKWLRFRHRVIRNIAFAVLFPYSVLKFGIKVKRVKEKRQFLILFNHQTLFDQFFVGFAFKGPIYYLATEDIFSNGIISRLLRYAVAPIPIKKQTTDVKAVIDCLRVAREGGTIALAPEGNRTYSGKTEHINPAISALAQKLKLPIAIFRIEGGYGTHPRWSDVVRRGKTYGHVSRVIEPEEYSELSREELGEMLCRELYVNEAKVDNEYHSKHLAEYLERAIYVCPKCGLSVFESNRDIIKCKKCGMEVRYLPSKELKGVGFEFPFHFVNDWYEYQSEFVSNLNLDEYTQEAMYEDVADVSRVIVYKKKIPVQSNAKIKLFGNRIVFGETQLSFSEISAVSVLGRNKLNIYIGDDIYQFKGSKRFNALKYVNVYYSSKNIFKGDNNGKFLGL